MDHAEHEPEPERLSQILPRLADGTAERLTVADLLERMQGRAHTALLVLFALPNALPSIPGTSAVTGVPLLYLSLQLALGRKAGLPGIITKRSFSRPALQRILTQATPWLKRADKFMHPRLQRLTSPLAERLVGLLMVFLALAVLLPIPFGNLLPAIAIICLCIGLMEEDGAWILAGIATTGIAILVFSTVLWGLFKAAIFVFLGAFGG
jgi:hypothetical protein